MINLKSKDFIIDMRELNSSDDNLVISHINNDFEIDDSDSDGDFLIKRNNIFFFDYLDEASIIKAKLSGSMIAPEIRHSFFGVEVSSISVGDVIETNKSRGAVVNYIGSDCMVVECDGKELPVNDIQGRKFGKLHRFVNFVYAPEYEQLLKLRAQIARAYNKHKREFSEIDSSFGKDFNFADIIWFDEVKKVVYKGVEDE